MFSHTFENHERPLIVPKSREICSYPKKIQASPQIFQIQTTAPIFEEPLIEPETPKKSTCSLKMIKLPTKKTKKGSQKSLRLSKATTKKSLKTIKSSGILIGVLKLVRRFIENLHYQIIYQNYQNLDKRHFEIINDKIMFDLPTATKFLPLKSIVIKESKFSFLYNCPHVFFEKALKILKIWYKFYDHRVVKLNPDQNVVFCWNLLLLIFLVFLILFIPVNASFQEDGTSGQILQSVLNFTTCLFFVTDIIIRFHLGYYEEGWKILDRSKIIKRYCGQRAFCDFLALLPFLLASFSPSADDPYLKLLFFFKIFRFQEIASSFEAKLCLNDRNEGLFNLVKVCCKILYVAHIIACIFHSIGSFMLSLNQKSWLRLLDKEYLNHWRTRYIYSIYWSVTTLITVGYGDITPQNQYEVLFTVFVILIGCGTFAYGINSIGSTFNILRKKEQDFNREAKILNKFMQRNNLDPDLRARLREYFRYISKEAASADLENEQAILKKLSSSLQHEVILNTTGRALKKIPMLTNNFSEDFLQKLVLKIKQKHCLPEEIIFEEESFETSLFFVLKGEVGLFRNQHRLLKVTSDRVFNEIPFLTNVPTNYSAQSLTHSSLFYINKQDFLDLFRDFPQDYERFCYIRDRISLYDEVEVLNLECELCGKKTHRFQVCPFVGHHIKPYEAIKKYLASFRVSQTSRIVYHNRKVGKNKRIVEKPLGTCKTWKTVSEANNNRTEEDYQTINFESVDWDAAGLKNEFDNIDKQG